MSQGYQLQFSLGGMGNVQFQNVSVDNDTDELDQSSSLNDDFSFNEGFSDANGDLSTLNVEVDSIIKDVKAQALMTFFIGGNRYPNVAYDLKYYTGVAGVHISGTGIYVRNNRLTVSIPGPGRIRMNFRSLQYGYDIEQL